jgi:hypothetical protein
MGKFINKHKKVLITAIAIIVVVYIILKVADIVSIINYQQKIKNAPKGSFIEIGNMNLPRASHSAIKLKDGRVLIVGGNRGAELFDPKTGKFKLINSKLESIGLFNNSLLLKNGDVLVANKYLFNPKTLKFKVIDKYDMNRRMVYGAGGDQSISTNLPDGKVFIIYEDQKKNKKEDYYQKISSYIYDPETDKLKSFTPNLPSGIFKDKYQIILLPVSKNKILIVVNDYLLDSKFILWDYKNNSYKEPGVFTKGRGFGYPIKIRGRGTSLILLPSNKVLIIGGGEEKFAETLDINTGKFKLIGKMNHARSMLPSVTLLKDGQVLIINGEYTSVRDYDESFDIYKKMSIEFYDYKTNKFIDGPIIERRTGSGWERIFIPDFTVTELNNRNILITGGKKPDGLFRIKSSIIYKLGDNKND